MARLLNEAFAAIQNGLTGESDSDTQVRLLAERASAQLAWAGALLDLAPVSRPTGAATLPPRTLAELANAFDDLLEDLEEQDPVAHANAIQVCTLAFAAIGGVAAVRRRRQRSS